MSLRRATTLPIVIAVAALIAGCNTDSTAGSVPPTTAADVAAAPANPPPTTPIATTATVTDAAAETTVPPMSPTTGPAGTSEPTAEAASSTAPAPTVSIAREYDFTSIDPVVAAFVDEQGLDGAGLIVVHRDDGVIYHEHWGEFDDDRVSFVASSSKMIAAGVLLALDDRGLLDIDASIADAVEWGSAQPAITPAQLVSNSSGLVGLIRDLVYATHRCQFESAGTLQACAESIFTSDLDDRAVVPPDTEFRYGGGQWQVAGAVAEAVSGMTWKELIDEVYVEPCGLDALGFNNHFGQTIGLLNPDGLDPLSLPPTNNPNIEGGAYVTTGDYGKLLLMLLRDGRCDDEPVLSPEAIEYMLADRVAAAYGGDADRPELGYGLGWWVDRSTGRRTDPGAYGSVAWLDADRDYGGFFLIEANQPVADRVMPELYALIDEAVGAP